AACRLDPAAHQLGEISEVAGRQRQLGDVEVLAQDGPDLGRQTALEVECEDHEPAMVAQGSWRRARARCSAIKCLDCVPITKGMGSLRNERGSALVLALVVLTTLIMVAMYLASQAAINRRMSSDAAVESKALRYAEAGVAEALARIQRGEGPDPYTAG